MKAVIPRIKPDPKCGAGKSGLVLWQAALSKQFMVYCFNASGTEHPYPLNIKPMLALMWLKLYSVCFLSDLASFQTFLCVLSALSNYRSEPNLETKHSQSTIFQIFYLTGSDDPDLSIFCIYIQINNPFATISG